jgi:hypothetical protein
MMRDPSGAAARASDASRFMLALPQRGLGGAREL